MKVQGILFVRALAFYFERISANPKLEHVPRESAVQNILS